MTLGGEQVEGRQPVRELLRAGRRRVHHIAIAEGRDESGSLGEILDLARAANVPVRRVARTQLASLALTDAPQGVVARADPLPESPLERLAEPALTRHARSWSSWTASPIPTIWAP